MRARKLWALLIICGWWQLSGAASIKGKLILDDSWAPVVYISVIQSFDDMQTAAYDFLRYKINLDATGSFEVDLLELPQEDLIYRLHISKKGDPESSIIIGGKDENFIHFMMNNESTATLIQDVPGQAISECRITGHAEEETLNQLFELIDRLQTPPALPSENNREFIKNQVLSELQEIVNTSPNAVIKLLAMHVINERFSDPDKLGQMNKLDEELQASAYEGTYYRAFSDQRHFLRFQAKEKSMLSSPWIFGISLGAILLIIILAFARGQNGSSRFSSRKLRQLSTQEMKVFELLREGKSNKEISSELHIEVSTVKSHLNKIYSRLGVKGRREIVD